MDPPCVKSLQPSRIATFQLSLHMTNVTIQSESIDVTIASKYNKLVEAHKGIYPASSLFYHDIIHKNKHFYPLIFLKGIQAK